MFGTVADTIFHPFFCELRRISNRKIKPHPSPFTSGSSYTTVTISYNELINYLTKYIVHLINPKLSESQYHAYL